MKKNLFNKFITKVIPSLAEQSVNLNKEEQEEQQRATERGKGFRFRFRFRSIVVLAIVIVITIVIGTAMNLATYQPGQSRSARAAGED